jgi:hypothetical protein
MKLYTTYYIRLVYGHLKKYPTTIWEPLLVEHSPTVENLILNVHCKKVYR